MGKLCLWLACLALGVAVGSELPAVPGEPRLADREAIRNHIDQIFRAYIAFDRATVRATHAPDWRGFLSRSRGVIRGIDQYMQEADAFLQGSVRLLDYQMADFDVVFYGDVAVVSYVAEVHWDLGSGSVPGKLRSLDIYSKQKGHWIQVASNLTLHPDTLAAISQQPRALSPAERQQLLRDREAVWRAYFANDRAHLETVIPEDTLAINAGEEAWADREAVLTGAKQFGESGARLLRLEFPRTEVRVYGDTAILYTTYLFETESQGQREIQSGRGTEIFVHRNGRWVNPGWHLDSGR